MTIPFEHFTEMHEAIDNFVVQHADIPQRLYVSFGLYTWLLSMQNSTFCWNSKAPLPESFFLNTHYGNIPVVVDGSLRNKEVLLE